jgi:hypothetical protein
LCLNWHGSSSLPFGTLSLYADASVIGSITLQ